MIACRHKYAWLLAVIPATLLASLLIIPTTGWLVRQQLRMVVASPVSRTRILRVFRIARIPEGTEDDCYLYALKRAAHQRPTDYSLQLTYALHTGSQLTELSRLIPDFPDRPSLYAHILRYMCQSAVQIHRNEEDLLNGKIQIPEWERRYRTEESPTKTDLATFDGFAAIGERVDPENAYFPLMRAVGLFAGRRDHAAVKAILRAAEKPRWDDYTVDEIENVCRTREVLLGDRSAVTLAAYWRYLLHPHFRQIRALARVATYKAIQHEHQGRLADAFAIRHALMKCGSAMREQSHSAIGSRVGIVVAAIAIKRPGGGPALKRPADFKDSLKWHQMRVDEYVDYLRRIGHPREAAWAKRESQAGHEAVDAMQTGWKRSPANETNPFLFQLVVSWKACILVLTNLLGMLVMLGLIPPLERQPTKWRKLLVVLALGGLFAVLLYFSVARGCWPYMLFLDVIAPLHDGAYVWNRPPLVRTFALARMEFLIITGIMILLGLLAALVVFGRSDWTIRNVLLSVACILTLLYGGLVFHTSHQEAYLRSCFNRILQHEGRFLHSLAGKQWPEPLSSPRQKR